MRQPADSVRAQRLITYCVGAAAFLFQFEAFFVHIALPDMQRELMVDDHAISQVITIYLLGAIFALLPGGFLGRRIGFSTLFWVACLVAAVGTLACGVATSLSGLWVSRLFQGIGIGLMVSSGYTLIPLWLEEAHLGWGYSVISQGAGFGMVLGLPLGGLVAQLLEWRWVFLVQLPLLLGLCVYSRAVLPSDIKVTANSGPTFKTVWVTLSQVPIYFYGLAMLFGFQCVLGGARYLLPFYLENVQHMTTLQSSLSMLIYACVMIFAAHTAGRYADRHGSGFLVFLALMVATVSSALFAWFENGDDVLWVFMLIASLGAGTGFFSSPNSRQIMSQLPKSVIRQAAGVLPIALNVGVMVGVFVFQAVFQGGAGYGEIYAGAAICFMLLALLQYRINFMKS